MTCGSCGATIADKAIVCYRCGAPTALTPAGARQLRPATGRVRLLPILLVVVAALLGVLAVAVPDAPALRPAATAGATVLALAAVFLWLRRR